MRALALVVVAGCVPYVIPPATIDFGAQYLSARGARTEVHADVGYSAMSLTRGRMDRNWDATLSGSFDRSEYRNTFGLAAAGGAVLHPWGLVHEDTANRLLIEGVGRWTTDGTALGARIAIEHAAFYDGSADDPNNSGYAYGEGGIGLYLETDRWSIDGSPSWSFTAGLMVRAPVVVGVTCCVH